MINELHKLMYKILRKLMEESDILMLMHYIIDK